MMAGVEGSPDTGPAPGWSYRAFETSDDGDIVVAADGPGGASVRFTVPGYVSRGSELGQIARLVIEALDRMHRSEGLGA
jgi:hypothetical protein